MAKKALKEKQAGEKKPGQEALNEPQGEMVPEPIDVKPEEAP